MSKKRNKNDAPRFTSRAKRRDMMENELIKAYESERKATIKERFKKAGIIIICLILIFALGIPTMAITVASSGPRDTDAADIIANGEQEITTDSYANESESGAVTIEYEGDVTD